MKYCPQCRRDLVPTEIGGAARFACPDTACGFVFWNNPVPVVVALLTLGDQVLLARNARWPAGVFSLVAGYLEQGETPADAALREVREELNLQARVHALIGHYPLARRGQLVIAYWLEAWGEIALNEELAEIKLLPAVELSPAMFPKLQLTADVVGDWQRLRTSTAGGVQS